MTEPTVAAYYANPLTLLCPNCRAVWRIVAEVTDHDRAAMLGWHDEHVCDPDVDPEVVESVRSAARELAADLPPDRWGHLPVTEDFRPGNPECDEWLALAALREYYAESLVARFGVDVALFEAATPHVPACAAEPWESILHAARCEATHTLRRQLNGEV